jgi:hypothetical protein
MGGPECDEPFQRCLEQLGNLVVSASRQQLTQRLELNLVEC